MNAKDAMIQYRQDGGGRYVVKCDSCGAALRFTNNLQASVHGGRCATCRDVALIRAMREELVRS